LQWHWLEEKNKMDRRKFIKSSIGGAIMLSDLSALESLAGVTNTATGRMPVIFVGHGSPTNAIEDNEYTRTWAKIGSSIPKPSAIVSVSAHWLTNGNFVNLSEKPRTIYDFYGFPKEMYELKYPAPGSPVVGEDIIKTITQPQIQKDYEWGLDHGTWAVLIKMFPNASIPVLQVSINGNEPPEFHYELGKKLSYLRNKGVLLFCSGNIVHNLGRIEWSDKAFDWAIEFDELSKKLISERNDKALIEYKKLGTSATLSIPTNEHYLPLIYALGATEAKDEIQFFNEKVSHGSLSMRGVVLG